MNQRTFFFYDRKKNCQIFAMKELKTTFHNFTKCLFLSFFSFFFFTRSGEKSLTYSFSKWNWFFTFLFNISASSSFFFFLVCEFVFFFPSVFLAYSSFLLFYQCRVVEIFRVSVCQLLTGVRVNSNFFESVVRQLLWSRGGLNDNTTRIWEIRNILKENCAYIDDSWGKTSSA